MLIPLTWLFIWAAARMDPGRVSILLLFEIVAAALSAGLLTDEPFGRRELLGGALIVAAAVIEGIDEIRGQAVKAPGKEPPG
jgi:drug/metabolite transporter (DMT)-like permease